MVCMTSQVSPEGVDGKYAWRPHAIRASFVNRPVPKGWPLEGPMACP